MSLLTECQIWSQRAISALHGPALGGRREMRLQATLGLSLMWTRGNSEATYAALNRSMTIAEQQGEALTQVLLLTPLHVFHIRIGEFRHAMRHAEQVARLSRTTEDAEARILSRILLGYSYHYAGDLRDARRELEAALRRDPGEPQTGEQNATLSASMKDDAMAVPILALAAAAAPSALARTLWLQGDATAAMAYVDQTLNDAAEAEHPVTLLVALIYAVSVLIWNGDYDDAEVQIARFIANALSYDLKSHVLLGHCFEGQLAISRGDMERGSELLERSLHGMRALRYELLTTSFNISLVQSFTAVGRFADAARLVDEAIQCVESNGDFYCMPELLRIKAGVLLCMPQPLEDLAEACLMESLALSRRQGALAWELRTSIDLARRWAAQDRQKQAAALLHPVLEQFAEGSTTADLSTAKTLLGAVRKYPNRVAFLVDRGFPGHDAVS